MVPRRPGLLTMSVLGRVPPLRAGEILFLAPLRPRQVVMMILRFPVACRGSWRLASERTSAVDVSVIGIV